jgi:uncharacterized membrane protein YfcA
MQAAADPALIALMSGLLVLIGAFAGVIAGLLGVGGGIVLVPAFFYGFTVLGFAGPQLMQVCLATSLATIVVTSGRSARAHNAKGAVDWAIIRGWAPGIVIGALIGVAVATALRSDVLVAVFGVLALIVGLWLAFGRESLRIGPAMPVGARRAAISPALGFLSVLMGIGGGSFGVPLMTLYGVPIHRAVGTASLFGMAIAVPSILGFLFVPVTGAPPFTLGAINVPAFLLVVAATWVTTPYGARLAHRTDARRLRRVFAAFLILVALNMLRKALGW